MISSIPFGVRKFSITETKHQRLSIEKEESFILTYSFRLHPRLLLVGAGSVAVGYTKAIYCDKGGPLGGQEAKTEWKRRKIRFNYCL